MVKSFVPPDPLFPAQWFLQNTGQAILGLPQQDGAYRNDIDVVDVWPDDTGAGVVVGVFDDGFQVTHPDLAPNLLVDDFYNYDTDRPGAADGSHGTATMGLIVAASNGIGGVGVAFDAKAIGYTGFMGNAAVNFLRADADMLLKGVSVSSNSWGPGNKFLAFSAAADQPLYTGTLLSVAQGGRGGLGIVTLFAGGNDRQWGYNTNYDPTDNSPYAITVAASNVDGTVSSYSTPGASILVAAPGSGNGSSSVSQLPSIVTTDLVGTAGYNTTKNGDYTDFGQLQANGTVVSSGFNGTSAATPIAAGVVALMLQANPRLGYRDVQEILAYSARTPTTAPNGSTVATWQANGATDWNGGGHLFNDDLGFGEIDARAAVRLAETWDKQSTYDNRVADDEDFAGGTDVTVAAGSTQTLTTTITSAIRVQHATVSVKLGTADLGNVTLTLVGPNGQTRSVLMDQPRAYSNPAAGVQNTLPTQLGYTFDTTHDWGELGTGTWQLVIGNASLTQDLTIAAALNVIGDAPPAGETFVYTDDYAALAAADPDRAVMGSTATGPATIDAAAVTSDTVIDLPANRFSIGDTPVALNPGMPLAKLITGDGNDTLEGGTSSTVFEPGRGNNHVTGHGPADTMVLLKGLADYTQVGAGDRTLMTGSESQDSIAGIATLQFADGTMALGSDPLVNDVFYAQHNADVFKAGVAADAHYAAYGWTEGRDPDAWFSTSAYLANHSDIQAADVDPLAEYDTTGWKLGYDPAANFSTSLYLKLNPDVAAAGIDPLLHFLRYGESEGRQAKPVVDSSDLVGGFDATYYKLANPDVARAGVDPLAHWQTYGVTEGRNPDAFFDTAEYLAENPDVLAAHVDPLQHYLTYGWKEGRNPSDGFNGQAYLSHYGDVAAAGVNPLLHYLQFGIAEGRSSFAA